MPSGVYIRTDKMKKNMSEAQKGKRLSEEHKKNMSKAQQKRRERDGHNLSLQTKKKISDAMQKRKERDGYMNSPDSRRKQGKAISGINNPRGMLGKHHTNEAKIKMREAMQERKERDGYINSPETRTKISKTLKELYKNKENHPFYGKHFSEEHKKKISGENHYKWNPVRGDITPYGQNFHNKKLRNRKWFLQNGRDMLTGTMLDPNKKPQYHHIDYCKSNDNLDNHCFISCSNHARITNYQQNSIKSERYKRILQENTQSLKNGQIPKNWSPLNKELFRQEKLKQLDLSSYII